MDLGLTGKRALVTGSSAGIGLGIARTLAAEGATVVITGRDSGRVNSVARELRAAAGRNVVAIAADLSTDHGAQSLADRALGELGGIDILVNNMGVYFERGWWNTSADDWLGVYNQNVVSVVRMILRVGPQMRAAGWGRIINIASGGGWQPFAIMADYSATKAAIFNLTVSLARELSGTGVTVNTVSPGIIVTDATEQYFRKVAQAQGWPDAWPEIEKRVMAEFLANSSGRLGKPEDVANVVALIASPSSGYINGANYRVDGGSTISIN